ncbi:hypothetical protein LOTGIDRAFT_168228 [Lottia gigantea]|uniref:Uncharacterized protein n=1 Tax=Lottia gigantea TaxID=225164 RepID=V3ZR13_LOTGI|nr:hypothetical protein LOTGIDRAFT_168228 [Lottia gigantea]ESO84970.1 hypothetical protein LOTGIDRAFT_168228 [Lottia gigantea]
MVYGISNINLIYPGDIFSYINLVYPGDLYLLHISDISQWYMISLILIWVYFVLFRIVMLMPRYLYLKLGDQIHHASTTQLPILEPLTTMLMTDSWQPSVLQLTPFGSNDASSQNDILYHEERNNVNKGFPRLAVTRVNNFQSARHKIVRSVSECADRPKVFSNRPCSLQGPRSQSEQSVKYKTAVKDNGFSVKDLNDQIIYSANTEILLKNDGNQKPKSWLCSSSSDFTDQVKYLPKPNVSRSLDGRYFLPQNGFWRAVTLTPGEIDLRKQKVYQDAKQRKIPHLKHKVNVNSLPRSNTPITDYDPDRLNMKNVVAFLQKNNGESNTNSKTTNHVATKSQSEPTTSPRRTEVTPSPHKFKSDVIKRDRSSHRVRISEPVPSMEQRFKKSESNYRKPKGKENATRSVRQFRLHRFLTMAAHDSDQTFNDSVASKAYPVYSPRERLRITPKNDSQENTNCNQTLSSDQPSTEKLASADAVIRLPNMLDEEHHDDDDFPNNVDLLDAIETVANAQRANSDQYKRKVRISETRGFTNANGKVKLSLRREKTLTREHTYMSDLAESRNLKSCSRQSSSFIRISILFTLHLVKRPSVSVAKGKLHRLTFHRMIEWEMSENCLQLANEKVESCIVVIIQCYIMHENL